VATPEQEEQVRRALAAAAGADDADRGSDRVPDDVAHRLDSVLADLVAQRSPRPEGHDELAERRRRRWPQVLVAAATIAVIVVGGGAVALRGMHGSGGSADSSAAGGAAEQSAPRAPQSGGKALAGGAAPGTPDLHRATLRRDLQAVVAGGALDDRARAAVPSPTTPSAKAAEPCPAPALPSGAEAVAVRLDGAPAVLVLGPVRDGTRAARVYSCDDTSAPVATTRVRAP
jgi:hypothetical protein